MSKLPSHFYPLVVIFLSPLFLGLSAHAQLTFEHPSQTQEAKASDQQIHYYDDFIVANY